MPLALSNAPLFLCLTVITIVQCEFLILMPDKLEAVNGSCIMIPCQFSIPNSQENNLRDPITGVWRKGSRWFEGSIDVYNSSKKINKLDGKILGDLTQKNCTSVLYNINTLLSDKYFFRLETGFKYTFEHPVMISVKDSLPEPILSQKNVLVTEGEEVELVCSIVVSCPQHPPNLTWVPLLGNCTENMEKQADSTFILSSVLRFVSTYVHHGENIACMVDHALETSGGYNVSQTNAAVTVKFPPKIKIKVIPPGPLRQGTNVTVVCSAAAFPAVTHLRWYRQQNGSAFEVNTTETNLTRTEMKTNLTTETNLTFIVTDENVGLYFCEAQNAYGKEKSSILQLETQEEYDVSYTVQLSSTTWLLLGCGGAALTLTSILMFRLCIKRWKIQVQNDVSSIYANINQCTNMKVCNYSNEAKNEIKEMDENVYSNTI